MYKQNIKEYVESTAQIAEENKLLIAAFAIAAANFAANNPVAGLLTWDAYLLLKANEDPSLKKTT